jgi:hypothetical protein
MHPYNVEFIDISVLPRYGNGLIAIR